MAKQEIAPPIKSGWKGDLNGCIEGTNSSYIEVSEVVLKLDRATAHALANLLFEENIKRSHPTKEQFAALSNLGAALGRLIDHPCANNGGREVRRIVVKL